MRRLIIRSFHDLLDWLCSSIGPVVPPCFVSASFVQLQASFRLEASRGVSRNIILFLSCCYVENNSCETHDRILTVSPRPSHPGHSLIDTHGDRYFELTHNFTAPARCASHCTLPSYCLTLHYYLNMSTVGREVWQYSITTTTPPKFQKCESCWFSY